MKRTNQAVAGLCILGMLLTLAPGCGTGCPIDTDGDGTISEAELQAIEVPIEPLELVGLLGCQSILSLEDLEFPSPEPTLSDRTVNEGEVFIVDASGLIDEDLEVVLWPNWQEFVVRRLAPLRWEVTAPLLGVWDETIEVRFQLFTHFMDSGAGVTGNPVGDFRVTVINTSLPADALSGWWSFSACSADLCRLQFQFDGDGSLVDWRWHENSNDPEVFVPEWQNVGFLGQISEESARLEFSGQYFQPQWRSIRALEEDRSYFNPADTVDRLSFDEKQALLQRVGTTWYVAMSFESSSEPYLAREGAVFVQYGNQEVVPLIICDGDNCDVSGFHEEDLHEFDPSRLWTEISKVEFVAP